MNPDTPDYDEFFDFIYGYANDDLSDYTLDGTDQAMSQAIANFADMLYNVMSVNLKKWRKVSLSPESEIFKLVN